MRGMGRHHRFDDAERWARRFEDPARDAWQKPEIVLGALALEPGHVVGDIGSATGYFPVRIAPKVPRGRVWGSDLEPAMVRYLNARARREGHANLFSILATADDPLFPEPLDRVLIVDTYHHLEHRTAYWRRLAASLRPGALVVVVDFKKGSFPVGPPDQMKVSPERIEDEMRTAGYRLLRAEHEALPYQFILVFQRIEAQGAETSESVGSGPQ